MRIRCATQLGAQKDQIQRIRFGGVLLQPADIPDMTGVRREPRIAVMILVEASWQDQTGILLTVPARMEDKSAGGACIRLKRQVGVGARLKIEGRREQFSGTARYCRHVGMDYLVGIQRDPAAMSLQAFAVTTPVDAQIGEAKLQPPSGSLPPQADETRSLPVPQPKAECVSISSARPLPGPERLAPRDNKETVMPRPHTFEAVRRTELPSKPAVTEPQLGIERKFMRRKWLELPRLQAKQNPPLNDNSSNGNGANGKHPSEGALSEQELSRSFAEHVAGFHVELLPMEDLYRNAGILNAPKGYGINKVVDMVHSAHIRNLSKEMKRAAVLMALDSAAIPIDQILRDAKARRSALDSYEAEQRKQLEAEWALKEEQNAQIEAELERIRAHYMARISRNMEAVAREKATFENWSTLKRQESQAVAEAMELCTKVEDSEPSARLLPEVSMAGGGAKVE
jgi:hypothetical protein